MTRRPGGNAVPPHLRTPEPAPAGPLVAARIDHTLLRPDATATDIERLCEEARRFEFAAVCVNPTWIPLAASCLNGPGPRVCTVIGFPLGAMTSEIKAREAQDAVQAGAHEVDMVISIGDLRGSEADRVRADVAAVRAAIGPSVTLKSILETALLTSAERTEAARLAVDGGADYVKTSTGFGPGGATVEAVAELRAAVGDRARVKASGGIRTLADARAMVVAGADRIGASAGVAMAREEAGLPPAPTGPAPSRSPAPGGGY